MKIISNCKKYSNAKGFTLVETLVSLSILSISVVALMSLLGTGLSNTNYVKKKVTAEYLTQEGIEFMRNLRDTYVLYDPQGVQSGWNAFRTKVNSCDTSSNSDNGCYFDDSTVSYTDNTQAITSALVVNCPGGSCPVMLYNPSTARYQYASGVSSGFIRKIQIFNVNADELEITSSVSWSQGSGFKTVTHSETLYSWVE